MVTQNQYLNETPKEPSIPLVNGWYFSKEERKNAREKKQILVASVEMTNYCNLDCKWCFTKNESKEERKTEITQKERLNIIDQISDLGAKTIIIPGAGEPLIDKNLEETLRHIYDKRIVPLVATNGSLINDEWIKIFQETNTSIMIKLNSFDNDKQDAIVGKKGYAEKRNIALKKLIEAGFNKKGKGFRTKLSLNALIDAESYSEIPLIFGYCRENNIMPTMAPYIPAGKTKDETKLLTIKKEFMKLQRMTREYDRFKGITYNQSFPYLGGVPCIQKGHDAIFIDVKGNIWDCVARTKLYGSIREISLKEALVKIKKDPDNLCRGCAPREDFYKKIKK